MSTPPPEADNAFSDGVEDSAPSSPDSPNGTSLDSVNSPDPDTASANELLLTRLAGASLPLMATALAATDSPFAVTGGTAGSRAGEGDYFYDSAEGILHIQTSAEMTISTPNQTDSIIYIDPGVKAELTLDGVDIRTSKGCPIDMITNLYDTADGSAATEGTQILHPTSLYLKIADGSENSLWTDGDNDAGIHCGEGSILVVDDALDNRASTGEMAKVVGAKVTENIILKSGLFISSSNPSSRLDSTNPGKLTVMGGWKAAGVGSTAYENGGTLTINGGAMDVRVQGWNISMELKNSYGAGIGAGTMGDGTATIITINGGTINSWGGVHGAGIGAGLGDPAYKIELRNDIIRSRHTKLKSNVAGDIFINGGFITSSNGWHGGAFGSACCSTNSDHTITVTGGTLIPSSGKGFPDIGGDGGYVVITGGSIYCSDPVTKFQGIGGTAWGNHAYEAEGYNVNNPNDPNKVEMITIDLAAELPEGQRTVPITKWELSINGVPQTYGAPSYLDEGKLYLWLPKDVKGKDIKVEMAYRDPVTGQARPVAPLFIEDAINSGIYLKRYVAFDLPEGYERSLRKYYDGTPLDALNLETLEPPLVAMMPNADGELIDDGRVLDEQDAVTCLYQHYRRTANGELVTIGPERSDTVTVDGAEVPAMPTNAGTMLFTLDSRQYANDAAFKTSYWGHRASGYCEIWAIPSVVRDLAVEWAEEPEDSDQRPGGASHLSDREILVSAVIDRGETVDGTAGGEATASTCKAPEGRVQLYVDGRPAGAPVDLDFGDGGARAGANAVRTDNNKGGSYTRFSFRFKASVSDDLLPEAKEGGVHELSLQFLPPTDEQLAAGVPANYLASANPAEDPSVPRATLVVEPIEPGATVEAVSDPEKKDPAFPEPDVTTGPGRQDAPGAFGDPFPGTTYEGAIRTTYGEPSETNPHPGRVILDISTPSTAPISVTDSKGNVVKAEFERDAEGNPVRNADGKYRLVVDPTAVGEGELTVRQEPNGAYTASTWVWSVKVNPDASIPPQPEVSKEVANLTYPDGPTQAGDVLAYRITASNRRAGSLWTDVVIGDALPRALEIVGGTLALTDASGKRTELGTAGQGQAPGQGQYALAAGADGRLVLSVPAGDIGGDKSAVVEFQCRVSLPLDLASAAADDLDLANTATASGTRPDPDDPGRPLPDPDDPGSSLPVDAGPTGPVTPPGPGKVVPADPQLRLEKTVQNLSRDDGTTRVGDTVLYEICLANEGPAASVAWDAVLADPLPAGIEPVAGTLQLAEGDGIWRPVSDGAYDADARTVAVACGDLWGGEGVRLKMECTFTASALGADNGNIAEAYSTLPSDDAERDPRAPEEQPGQAAEVPEGNPLAESDPATPPTPVPDDPEGGDVAIAKTAGNATRDDGTVHVGDTVRYEIRLRNSAPGTGWIDAVVRDDVPRGVEPVSGTISLALPDGSSVAVPDAAYDPASRILAVAVGRLYGGQEARLTFDALVTEDAVGADIGNVAAGYGTLPSMRDPDDPELVPGEPFSPAEGWDAYGARRDVQTIRTDPVYPEGAEEDGGVIDDGEPADDSTTIARKLAQTGDRAAAAALGLSAAAALAACALALASRRREHRTR